MSIVKKEKFQTSFEKFGIEFIDEIDGQLIADCPFSQKARKLYVNPKTGQWDSKSASIGGNLFTFIREFYAMSLADTSVVEWKALANDRGLPLRAIKDKVAYNSLTGAYMIPEVSMMGKVSGVGHYKIGTKMVLRTKGTKTVLNGSHLLKGNKHPVYICEGEWDWLALQWLHNELMFKSVVVCVPGAGTFKTDWVACLKGRKVYTCYDNDDAGFKGETKAQNILKGVASSIKFLKWEDDREDGFDVRDLILEVAKPLKTRPKVKRCFKTLQDMMDNRSRHDYDDGTIDVSSNREEDDGDGDHHQGSINDIIDEDDLIVPSVEETEAEYGRWLKMKDGDSLAFMFGVCLANRISGDPVWAFIVAPPGGSKTALLRTLNTSSHVKAVSTLTPASLMSGMRMNDGIDPSLIPQLDGKMLIVKDFTTILSMNDNARDEVFGILRDAYDGYIEKQFGNGLLRSYKSSFGMLCGVTPTIDTFQSVHSSLGERYIKYRMDKNIQPEEEEERLRTVLHNISNESTMDADLECIGRRVMAMKVDVNNLPTFSEKIAEKVIKCARYTAKLRSSVDRDKYTDALQSIPTTEVATRLTKVYMKFAMGVSLYYGKKKVGKDAMRLLRKVTIDTAPAMHECCMKTIYKEWKRTGKGVATVDILSSVPYCSVTLGVILRDLTTLKIIHKIKSDEMVKTFYKPSKNIIDMIQGAGIYKAK